MSHTQGSCNVGNGLWPGLASPAAAVTVGAPDSKVLKQGAGVVTIRYFKREGFSLVELIVVMAVIAILAAIIVPRYTNMRGQAADSRVIAMLGSIRTALGSYEASYEAKCSSSDRLPCGHSDWFWNPLRDRLREFAELPGYQTLMSIAWFVDGCAGYGSFAGRGYFVMMGREEVQGNIRTR